MKKPNDRGQIELNITNETSCGGASCTDAEGQRGGELIQESHRLNR